MKKAKHQEDDQARSTHLWSEAVRIALSLLGKNERHINDELDGWWKRSPELCQRIEEILRVMKGEE